MRGDFTENTWPMELGMCLPVTVHDSVEPMSDCEDGAVGELSSNRLLDQLVGLEVDGSSRLVQNEDLGLAEDGTCQTDQLTLANTDAKQVAHQPI